MLASLREGEALRIISSEEFQHSDSTAAHLQALCARPGVRRVVALPDLHRESERLMTGLALLSKERLYPDLLGDRTGGGRSLFATSLDAGTAHPHRWADQLHDLEHPWDGDRLDWLNRYGLDARGCERLMGVIGGGSQCAELQQVHKVLDRKAFDKMGLDARMLLLMVQASAGRRGKAMTAWHRPEGLIAGSAAAEDFMSEHDRCLAWASANRALIAQRFAGQLGAEIKQVMDVSHFRLSKTRDSYLHRAGALPSHSGPVLLRGHRGGYSYLVEPLGAGVGNLWSLARAAGRKWSREQALERLKDVDTEVLERTAFNGRIICDDRRRLLEEAPLAFRHVERVIEAMENQGLCRIIAILRPLVTYKTRYAPRQAQPLKRAAFNGGPQALINPLGVGAISP